MKGRKKSTNEEVNSMNYFSIISILRALLSNLAFWLGRREGSVVLLLFDLGSLSFDIQLLELGQETIPRLVLQRRIFHQFFLDHHCL